MKVFVIATRADRPFEEFAPLMDKEAKQALTFMVEDFVREIYSRKDGKGAILVCEGESEEAVLERLSALPLVQAGLLSLDAYPVGAYRAIETAAKSY